MKPDTDYEKREQLIQAAKEEFMEKGYNKASLRSICSKAGMTTGALYFFFENKEDLYEEITGSAKNELKELMKSTHLFKPDPFMSHWIAHTIVDSFVHVVTHEPDVEKAKVKMRFILNFIVQGWTSLLVTEGSKNNKK